jgi:starch synthase
MHLHDWPVGLIPVYLNGPHSSALFAKTASVFTIHNIGYQGVFARQDIYYTSLDWESIRDKTNPADDTINFLRLGIRDADALTTVSPSYANEIQSPRYGAGLDRLLVARRKDLTGILNGIDYEEWDPGNDPLIPHHYTEDNLAGKALDKTELQRACALPVAPYRPVIGIISRLVDQKGFVELADPNSGSIRRICETMEVQIILLGMGEPWFEQELRALDHDLPNFRAMIGFDNKMAHLIEAGADLFLMPSRYEPCGLNQMYSLRYGTLPIVRRTGGLADTVEQYDQGTGAGTGFLFDDLTAGSVYDVTGWAVWAWYNRPEHIESMRRRAMKKRFSWEKSALQYREVYRYAVEKHRK